MSKFITEIKNILDKNNVKYDIIKVNVRKSEDLSFNGIFYEVPTGLFQENQDFIRFFPDDIVKYFIHLLDNINISEQHVEKFIQAVRLKGIRVNLRRSTFKVDLKRALSAHLIPLNSLKDILQVFSSIKYSWNDIEKYLIEDYIITNQVFKIHPNYEHLNMIYKLPLLPFFYKRNLYIVPTLHDLDTKCMRKLLEAYFALVVETLPTDSIVNDIAEFKEILNEETFEYLKRIIVKPYGYIINIKSTIIKNKGR